ncbi:hypothetical protein T06_16547 [Trichinella sp. T6]|nr:hypothetical protein T06_16547 [Trichinella sp. T6]
MNADASGGILLNITIDCNQTIVHTREAYCESANECYFFITSELEEDYEDRCYKLAQHRSLVKGTINKAIRSTKKQMPVSVQTNDSSKV